MPTSPPPTHEKDHESHQTKRPSHFRLVFDQACVTDEVLNYKYAGSGTREDPYIVEWLPDDPRNPMNFSQGTKWTLTVIVGIATFVATFVSSVYTGGIHQVLVQFDVSQEVVTLGLSLFVLGFAIGPLLWAPLSELFGRQIVFITTSCALSAFSAGASGSQNIHTLIILRFFAGIFGGSPLTNAGGCIADMFSAEQRGLALSVFTAAPFMGPALGPIVGGFLGEAAGWRWVEGLMAIFSGVVCIVGGLLIPETYAPVLLRKRAVKLSKMSGYFYKSRADAMQGDLKISKLFRVALSRPWILLFKEPIVLITSLYLAIVYGTLYMMFSAFPIVFQENRGWTEGIGGLAFLGVAAGILVGIGLAAHGNKRYIRAMHEHGGIAPPEARLQPAMVGSIALPIGLFWFAWTNNAEIHWIVAIVASALFGFGLVLVFLGIMNYLIDSYTIFAASVLAASSVLRSLFAAVFPLFTTYMYRGLGIHWASSIPAFLALACAPFPFLFYKYGARIRERCFFAAEAAIFARELQEMSHSNDGDEEDDRK